MRGTRLQSTLERVNQLPCWRLAVPVWGSRLTPPTLDRAVYLWLHHWGRFGGEERACLEREVRPGMRVADVGANIGVYSLLLARLVGSSGRVSAFEPDPLMVKALRRNVADNAAHVDVFAVAAGARDGSALLMRDGLNSGDLYLSNDRGRAVRGAPVAVRTLGSVFGRQRLDFVKIDAQGWEVEVLRGAGPVLDANPHLTMYIEFWPEGLARAGSSVSELSNLLDALRLHAFPTTQSGESLDLGDVARRLRPGGFTNLLVRR